ncbi:MerR family transcriptional regulator [Corynebacterium glyciniphilum]|uniref:MerR family transcriptional regulator n=1 Tax=Corynebacterium glyciniphilum TaxID=1404244 RepID=UPI003FD02E75
MTRTIGETAAKHHVDAHVLRHWEDVGALRPQRTSAGHRRYGEVEDSHIELIKCAQTAGLRLDQIVDLIHGRDADRQPLIRHQLETLEHRAAEIGASIRLLQHVLKCESPDFCPQCTHPEASFGFLP